MIWKGWEDNPIQRPPLNSRLDPSLGDPGRQEVHTTVCNDKVSFPPHCRHTLLSGQLPIEILSKPPIHRPPSSKSLPVTISRGCRCSPTIFRPRITKAHANTAASVSITSNPHYVSPHDRRHPPRLRPPLEQFPHAYPPLHDLFHG